MKDVTSLETTEWRTHVMYIPQVYLTVLLLHPNYFLTLGPSTSSRDTKSINIREL